MDSLDPRSVDSRDREPDDPRDADSVDPRDVFSRDLDLPRGLERERVHANGREADLRHGDLYRLRSAGLVRAVAPLDRGKGTTVVALTERGRDLLETHR